MSILLLDVNALLALAWPNHQFHGVVVDRLERTPHPLWATCAITQLGFVRLSCNRAVVGCEKLPKEATALLQALVRDERHKFLERLPAVSKLAGAFDRIMGHQQVTDAYLLALARHHKATLLTFDRRLVAAAPDRQCVETLPG